MLPFWGTGKACVVVDHTIPGTLVRKFQLDNSSQARKGCCLVLTSPIHILSSKYVGDNREMISRGGGFCLHFTAETDGHGGGGDSSAVGFRPMTR